MTPSYVSFSDNGQLTCPISRPISRAPSLVSPPISCAPCKPLLSCLRAPFLPLSLVRFAHLLCPSCPVSRLLPLTTTLKSRADDRDFVKRRAQDYLKLIHQ